MKQIGSTFAAELAAAGLSGLPFSWTTVGEITFGDSITQQQIAAVMDVYSAHDPRKADLDSCWEKIKEKRDQLTQNGGYPLDGFWFHSDAYSLSQQQGLIISAMQVQSAGGDMNAPLMTTPWYAIGSAPVELTASLALRLLPAAMAQQVAIFEAAKTHKAALDACSDPASYDFSKGWPKVYGDK